MIKIKQTDFEEIVRYAKSHLPEEACGLIGGTVHGGEKIVEKIYYLENTDHSNEHFSLDVKQQLTAIKDMRAKNLLPLGNFHSHPETPARPSDEDKKFILDKNASYMILSLEYGPTLKAFVISDEGITEEQVLIIGKDEIQ